MAIYLHEFSLDRAVTAVEKVKERLLRATSSLERAQVPYAVVGGNAVALWVARVDESAVRNTRDVDILLRRDDLPRAKLALEADGFVYRHTAGIDMFLDGPEGKPREGVHVVFANEFVRPGESETSPDVEDAETSGPFRVLSLEALVRIKLTAFRDRDRVHLRDLIEVGLVDGSWLGRFPGTLADRLRSIFDNPE